MATFNELKKAARTPHPDFPCVSMALVGDTATQMLATCLRGEAALRGLRLDLYEADYGSLERELLQPDSTLRGHGAQFVVVYCSVHQFAARHAVAGLQEKERLAQEELAFFEEIASDPYFAGRTLVFLNMPMLDDGVFGGYAPNVPTSLPAQIRELNYGLQRLAQTHRHVAVCDMEALQAEVGSSALFDEAVFATSELEFSLNVLPLVCKRLMDMVSVRRGTLRKVLVSDLDNTLWGGVVSEDGVGGLQIGHGLGIGRAYSNIQRWIKKLVQRGVVLCVVSKNDDAIAREPFSEHPDMIISMEDVAVFLANWETKAENILRLSEILNIGTDQMVFLDDNPFERNLVRQGVSGVCVPELPEDPALWVSFLSSQHLFDTASVSMADAGRTRQYREEAKRVAARKRFAGEDEFLASLGMEARVEGLTSFNLPRAAQLTQRSNQFNLRTRRYTESELSSDVSDGSSRIPLCFSLRDKYGDHGLVSVVILERTAPDTVFIDTWLMSCRVLKRGMEHFVANTVVETAKALGAEFLTAEYIPSAKNAMVANLLPTHGFSPAPICGKREGTCRHTATTTTAVPYRMRTADYEPVPCHIRRA